MTDETVKEPTKPNLKLSANKDAAWWGREIPRSRKGWKTYRERARKVIDRYRDERDDVESTEGKTKKFNILYSNTETLGPAIYSQVPVPDIRRRWQDRDAVGRLAATILQRATQYCIESYDFDGVLDACKQDYLLPGFTTARVKYKPYLKKEGEVERVVYQEVATEYVHWDLFTMSRSKTYDRVWYVAFGDDLTKDEVKEQFGQDIADKVPYGRKEEDSEDSKGPDEQEPVARVWEVWCKRGRGRFVVAEGFDGWLLEPEADPLRLEHFYPNAKPVWSVSTNDTLKPVPEYLEYQDQALELDDLTERIDVLTSALRRRGVYDAKYKELVGMLKGTGDNQFVPVENWAAFISDGGLEKLAFEMPLDQLVAAVVALEDRRERVKQTIYEITGISDIVRGASDPNETATAQTMKGRWAGLRISTRQKKFANFARDLVRLKAEVIAERFDAQTLSLMSGIQLPTQAAKMQYQQTQAMAQQQAQMAAQQAQTAGQEPPAPPQENPEEARFYAQPTWEDVIQVLRDDKLRGFKIEIETDSTVQPDADAEKTARTELLVAIGDSCQRLGAGVQSGLISQEFAKETLAFTLRAFKAGTVMEEALEALTAPQGPTPEQQQKEQELQQREQALMQAEQKAKDDQHRAELAKKDAQNAADKLAAAEENFDLRQQFARDLEAARGEFTSQIQGLIGDAESTVNDIFKQMDGARAPATPQGAA